LTLTPTTCYTLTMDLTKEISDHLDRCRTLAEEAEQDTSSPLSQRAAALTSMNNLLREMTRSQLEVINMARLQVLEQTLIELLTEMLSEEQLQEFLTEYERRLSVIESRDE
jgi:hypothetical protein